MTTEDRVRRALAEHARDVSAMPDVEALVARGAQARSRRRLTIIAAVAATTAIALSMVAPLLRSTAGLAPVVGTPSPSPVGPTVEAVPHTAVAFFAGSANVPVALTMPEGWQLTDNGSVVVKFAADPAPVVAFVDVVNLYADGCRWVPLKPPVGPSVDDLVTAFGEIPELRATAGRPVTVDGFRGQRLQFTAPDYRAETCKNSTFSLVQEDTAGRNVPQDEANQDDIVLLYAQAQTPNQQNEAFILDVDGNRLVILIGHPPDISGADQADVEAILRSVRIG